MIILNKENRVQDRLMSYVIEEYWKVMMRGVSQVCIVGSIDEREKNPSKA